MDTLIRAGVGFAIGVALVLSSHLLTQGWLSFCKEEWSVPTDRRVSIALRSFILLMGCLFILLGFSKLLLG